MKGREKETRRVWICYIIIRVQIFPSETLHSHSLKWHLKHSNSSRLFRKNRVLKTRSFNKTERLDTSTKRGGLPKSQVSRAVFWWGLIYHLTIFFAWPYSPWILFGGGAVHLGVCVHVTNCRTTRTCWQDNRFSGHSSRPLTKQCVDWNWTWTWYQPRR